MKAIWQRIWDYIRFKKPDPNTPVENFNLKTMHVINKISIFMFIIAIFWLLYKWYFR